MDAFTGKLAVVTGGGSGMGRELARQLAAQGCSVAMCDLNVDSVTETAALARADAPAGVRVTSHFCDVAEAAQVLRFRDELLEQHTSDHVDLVFNNAGIGGGESFVAGSREVWERTFAIDWCGVYYCSRAFLPLLKASADGVLVNTSRPKRQSSIGMSYNVVAIEDRDGRAGRVNDAPAGYEREDLVDGPYRLGAADSLS